MGSDAIHFYMCSCPMCAGSFSADNGTVTGGSSAPPTFTLAQVQTQLRTQWGGNQEGKTWTWLGTTNLTYSIDANVTGVSESSGLVGMTTLMEDRARLAFELWDDLIALSLTESPGNANANITFNYSSNTSGGGTYAWWNGYSSGGNFGISRAYIWLNSGWNSHNTDASMAFGGYGFITYLHEIGHTLGLSHPGTYDAGNGGSITYANNAEYAQDSRRYTVMSYFDADEAESFVDHYGASGIWKYAQTPLLHDIAAIQAVYGADTTTRTGDTVYGFNSTAGRVVYDFSQNSDPILVIWDSGGTDTLDCSGYSTNQLINLTAGSYSNIGYLTYNVAIAFNCTIENAIGGSGADTINGNSANNVIQGGGGADTIDGADGNDTLNGGAGNDMIWGGAGDDTFVYSTGADVLKDFTVGAGGVDEIDLRALSNITSLADVLARATQVDANTVINFGGGNTLTLENVNRTSLVSSDFLFSAPPAQSDLTASGLVLTGTSLSYTISNGGADPAGASTSGIYLSTDGTITSADMLVATMSTSGLAAGGSVTQGMTLTLPGNLAAGTYYLGVLADYNGQLGETNETNNASNVVAVILGNDSANTFAGTSAADTLIGLAGDDIIDGGANADILNGGSGSDTASYATATAGITARIDLGFAVDVGGAFDSYVSIENVTGSDFADVIVGKPGEVNVMFGGSGDDTFVGEGIDIINGGAGNDVFFGGQGCALNIDLNASSIETVWGSFVGDVMNGSTATSNLTLVGQGLEGGANADTMTGGSGNDLIYFRAGDVIDGGAGCDWAVASLSSSSVTLNMTATRFENAWGSTFNDNITAAGSATSAVIVGDAGNDILTGGNAGDFLYGFGDNDILNGGGGNDNLFGGAGIDTFAFGANWGADIVWDWVNGSEQFNMQGSGATSFGDLTINQNYLASGNALITFGGNQILVVGGAGLINATDFLF